MTLPKPQVIIDTDPGIDDAIAILMALAYPGWELLGLTTVGGNVSAHQATRNALALLEYAQATSIPLARGSSRPLEGRFANAHHFHGPTGLSHPLPLPETRPVPGGAVNFMAQHLLRGISAVKIVALGPLTNIARLLRRFPAAAENISSLVVMGGAVGVPGNVTAGAEFNFYCDPTAAAEVMASGIPITLIDLGASRQAVVNRAEGETVRSSHPLGWLAARLISNWFAQDPARQEFQFYDPLALAAAIQPQILQTRPVTLTIDTAQNPGACTVASEPGPIALPGPVYAQEFFHLLNSLLDLDLTGVVNR